MLVLPIAKRLGRVLGVLRRHKDDWGVRLTPPQLNPHDQFNALGAQRNYPDNPYFSCGKFPLRSRW